MKPNQTKQSTNGHKELKAIIKNAPRKGEYWKDFPALK